MRRLTVLNVAFPLAPLGPDSVEGAEQVLVAIDRALVLAGHRSLVIACEGSTVAGELIATAAPEGVLDAPVRAAARERTRAALAAALAAHDVDVVHLHGLDFADYLPGPGVPVLATLHLPPAWYPRRALRPERPETYLNCVSASQAAACADLPALLGVIPDGVPVESFPWRARKDGFALALGRIAPEKGCHLALDAAKQAGTPLILAGQLFPFPEHERYFAAEIQPRLDDERRYVGPVGDRGKRELLARASCLLVPSLAPETSSLVAMEAMAAGTPVVAFPAGALAELVTDWVTGFLVEDVEAMALAIDGARSLLPARCRREAERRFSADRMCARYLRLYARLARRHRRRPAVPAADRVRRRPPGAAPPPGDTRVEVLTRLEELERLEPGWRALFEGCPAAPPFLAPAWLLPWCRHLGRGEPRVVTVRRGGRLIGLAPLETRRVGARRLVALLGTGVSDCLDLRAAPDERLTVLRATVGALARARRDWDACELEALPEDGLLAGLRPPRGWKHACAAAEVRPVLAAGDEGLEAAVPAGLLRRLRQAERRARREGALGLERADERSLPEVLEHLVRLHAARWGARGGAGLLADPAVQAFHREAAPRLLAAGLLRLYALRLDGRVLAAWYGLQAGGRLSCYLGGFDPAAGRLSPGSLLLRHAIGEAAREGATEVDFLRGAEPHKYAWGARDRLNLRLRLWWRDGARARPERARGG